MSVLVRGDGAFARTRRSRSRGGPATVLAPLLGAAASVGVWLAVFPTRTPDLAAAYYRLQLYRADGLAVWDDNWFGGHHVAGYSLLFGPLGDLLGLRALGAVAVLVSASCFALLAREHFAAGAAAGATLMFGLAAGADLWIGRVPFAVGVAFGMAAALALSRRWWPVAVVLSAACAAASPVAGLFAVLAGVALLCRRRWGGSALALPALIVVVALALLFPEGGSEPFPATSFAATLAAAVAFVVVLGRAGDPALRAGGLLYLVAVVLSLLVPTPMGSNVGRLGVLLAGPLLIGAVAVSPSRGRRAMLAAAVVGLAVWVAWGPVREVGKISGDPSTRAAFYAPLQRFLADSPPGRVEVPFTRSHWAAAWLGRRHWLARGWEGQLDHRYDALFFDGRLTPASYHRWLDALAVRYVALPDVPLDGSSRGEATLLRGGLPYLKPVWSNRHWRVWEVLHARPLVTGPGSLVAMGHDGFSVAVRSPGRIVVAVRYTRYWDVVAGDGCVGEQPGGWTVVDAPRAGVVQVRARFSVGRALGRRGGCRA